MEMRTIRTGRLAVADADRGMRVETHAWEIFPMECVQPTRELAAGLVRATPSDGREHLGVMVLNAHGRPLVAAIVCDGSVDFVPMMPRDVFVPPMVTAGARYIGVWHNHPSGQVDPSDADRQGSALLAVLGQQLGVDVLWSVVVTHESDAWAEIPLGRPAPVPADGDDAQPQRMPPPPVPEPGEPNEEPEPEPEPEEPEEPAAPPVAAPQGGDVRIASVDDLRAAMKRALGK